jgi:hypothetical protein
VAGLMWRLGGLLGCVSAGCICGVQLHVVGWPQLFGHARYSCRTAVSIVQVHERKPANCERTSVAVPHSWAAASMCFGMQDCRCVFEDLLLSLLPCTSGVTLLAFNLRAEHERLPDDCHGSVRQKRASDLLCTPVPMCLQCLQFIGFC